MLSTASSEIEAKKIAHGLLSKKLAACVNIVPQVQSIYEWQGKIEESQEFLLIIKTRQLLAKSVTAEIKALHSYDVPESIVLPIQSDGSNGDYISWLLSNTGTAP
jgi:periplasmic divalent cation tolerance protein